MKPFEMRELFVRVRAVLRREASNLPPVLGNEKIGLDPQT